MLKAVLFFVIVSVFSVHGTPFLCNSLNSTLSIFLRGTQILTGNFKISVNFQEDGFNQLSFFDLTTTFTADPSKYYFESEFIVNPDFHFGQNFTKLDEDDRSFLIYNDTVDLKFWFYIKKHLFFIPSYLIVDQGFISFQSGELIDQSTVGQNLPWNRTDICKLFSDGLFNVELGTKFSTTKKFLVTNDVSTVITRKCLSYNFAPVSTENTQCTRFTMTSHIFDTENNNDNLVATIMSKLNINGDLMDISNDFTTSLNTTKFAINVNFYYTTNYTKGSSQLTIPLSSNRKYIFMLNFEIDDLTFIHEYLGKFIKRDNYYLSEEGIAFPNESDCLSQTRFLHGSSTLRLQSFMCCFT